ncbi:DUF423 domain-containing protein [Arachidicoccus soli]|uniref:DUF423 domain-containing protein n=1 Tax=Arachidicoccus soli TaxID=2341117 RepID=A0A386HUS9_9BACT|nr:DUF423 domain-containing protein [Arachidicoccus soli]AYD49144.1 DUF423 domain-containing protein [Arachidicoccus soli]
MNKSFIRIAAILGALSVVLGAFAAHGLKEIVSADALQIFETGVRYQMYHVFALAITGVVFAQAKEKFARAAGNLFIAGIILFSGSLYALTFAVNAGNISLEKIGVITPIGGLCFILAWILLALSLRSSKP